LVLGPDALPGLVTVVSVVSDETWDRASVKDDPVTLWARFGGGRRLKLSYEIP
jgi:hypothetical protein